MSNNINRNIRDMTDEERNRAKEKAESNRSDPHDDWSAYDIPSESNDWGEYVDKRSVWRKLGRDSERKKLGTEEE